MLDDNVHLMRCLTQLRSKDKAIEKNIFLSQLKHSDEYMFYRLLLANMEEITPLIYTPTVGDACLQYSANYRQPEGMVSIFSSFIKWYAHADNLLSSFPSRTEVGLAKSSRHGKSPRRPVLPS
jgi:malic enzyme